MENGVTHTDPRIPDTDNDGDGLWSTFEGAIGTNPNSASGVDLVTLLLDIEKESDQIVV